MFSTLVLYSLLTVDEAESVHFVLKGELKERSWDPNQNHPPECAQ